jgi:hypothetical protein
MHDKPAGSHRCKYGKAGCLPIAFSERDTLELPRQGGADVSGDELAEGARVEWGYEMHLDIPPPGPVLTHRANRASGVEHFAQAVGEAFSAEGVGEKTGAEGGVSHADRQRLNSNVIHALSTGFDGCYRMILHGEIHSVSWQFYRAFPASTVVAVHMFPLSRGR